MGVLLAGCAFIAASVGVVTFHAVGHGGHVEIAPAAVAHARTLMHAKREPRATRTPPATPTATSKMPFLAGNGEHEPKKLIEMTKRLQALALDVSLVDVQMAKPFAAWPDTKLDFLPTSSVPVYGWANKLDGLELHGIPVGSTLAVAGIAEGDQLLGIDGFTFAEHSIREVDPNVIRRRGSMIVEIARGDHHVVLSIHWPVR